MNTSDNIADRIRAENEKVIELADALRKRVAVVPRSNLAVWIRDMQEQFEKFRAHKIKHMALEERDGYMQFVLEQRPTLAPQVDQLKHEHAELARIMDGVHKAVADLMPDDKLRVRDCCDRIRNLLSYVEHHENAENMLVTFVFTYDMGANH